MAAPDRVPPILPSQVAHALAEVLHPWVPVSRCHLCRISCDTYYCRPCRGTVRGRRARAAARRALLVAAVIAAIATAGLVASLVLTSS